ncbi:DNA-3-methyladenine glycosylase I [Arachnia propionica]|uniref:DNA-3-methyladenine glycosylase I n=1 Tax=Arachnia propionica TaxID=1750 RepID=UPI000F6EEE2E|nr:DNA-3-methyladenine glycosylase I [Arachnia propionica]VEJ57693.1 DNA-3-methyladenine glycosylase 1 [Arachnia propionica]
MERCFGTGDPLYEHYHDTEWGRPLPDDPEESLLLERLVLEGFQSGLNWIMILRKREAFRAAFAGFDPETVAGFGEEDVARLMADSGIIRNEMKIRAAIANAKALVALHVAGGRLADIFAEHAPSPALTPPENRDEIPTRTPGSEALSYRLKNLGFRFVGPVTLYSTMQAIGLVNDHLASCWVRETEA